MAKGTNYSLPSDWKPDNQQMALLAQYPGMPPIEYLLRVELPKFRSYWIAERGAGKVASARGWAQAWGNWCRNSVKFGTAAGATKMAGQYLERVIVR